MRTRSWLLSIIIALVLCLIPVSVVCADQGEVWPFTDVKEQPGDWVYNSAKYVYDNGLMSGLNTTTFGAAELLSRAQFAVILHRMNGSPEVAYTAKFPDVPNGTWYSIPVSWANSVGAVTGYAHNSCFGPADPITREQMILMMYRYENYCDYDTSSQASLIGYQDYNSVSDYAVDAMSWAVGTGIITGDQGRLNPQGKVNRAVCATIIKRFRQKYVEGIDLPVVVVPQPMPTCLLDTAMYTYENMVQDSAILLSLYPDLVTEDTLAVTADGREILHFVVGNPNAEKQIFVNGAIHAREYMTTQLVMKQMAVYLQHVREGDFYGETSYQDMWQSCAIHVVPMVNPDGVAISQYGLNGIRNESIRNGIYDIAAMDGAELTTEYLNRWKANALGVDLNRNFDAWWEAYADPAGHPSSDHYKGLSPGSEIESAALIALTENNHFSYTISYHNQGRIIYWIFDNIDAIYNRSLNWATQLSAATGYSLVNDYSIVDPAGYSDWGIYRCQIPSVTIEVASGYSPYLSEQFPQVWEENKNVWQITVMCAMQE